MRSQKSNPKDQDPTPAQERRPAIYNLMRNFVEYECAKSHRYTNTKDLEKEVQNRLALLLS
jgi:hypothetical protein